MNKITSTLALLFGIFSHAVSQETDSLQWKMDSLENTFKYQTGTIALSNGIGTIEVPKGFKYLDATQSEYALTEVWGNPKGTGTLGMLFPENTGVTTAGSFVFNIQYDELGYVKDDDAGDINYDDLLKDMQKETEEGNAEREKEGYEPIHLVGWAAKPSYNADKKVLYWAKEIQFGSAETNTLNYNVRVLGRKGVVVLNAIAGMDALAEVDKEIPLVLSSFSFSEGNRYGDFNPEVDEVAAWTIGGLVAGKVLAKVGFFALILKFWKIIGVAIIAGGGALWKRIRGRKNEEEELSTEPVLASETPALPDAEENKPAE